MDRGLWTKRGERMKRRWWEVINIKRRWAEVKVGIFFFFSFLLLFVTLFSIRELSIFKGTYLIKVEFDFAEGLRTASPVRFCGVDIGEVKSVEVMEKDGNAYVCVGAKIQNDVRIPRDSYFFINSLSLFGEKYLEIAPGSSKDGYLEKEEKIEGISPIPLFNVFATFDKTMKEISAFVKEGKLKESLERTLLNIEKSSEGVRILIEDMQSKEGTVGRLLYDDSLYKKTEEFIEDIKNHPWKLLHKPKASRKR